MASCPWVCLRAPVASAFRSPSLAGSRLSAFTTTRSRTGRSSRSGSMTRGAGGGKGGTAAPEAVEQVLELLRRHQPLPKAVVFDLDYTVRAALRCRGRRVKHLCGAAAPCGGCVFQPLLRCRKRTAPAGRSPPLPKANRPSRPLAPDSVQIWNCWCEMYTPSHTPPLYPHVPAILDGLRQAGILLAVASRTPTPHVANAFLDKSALRERFHRCGCKERS